MCRKRKRSNAHGGIGVTQQARSELRALRMHMLLQPIIQERHEFKSPVSAKLSRIRAVQLIRNGVEEALFVPKKGSQFH